MARDLRGESEFGMGPMEELGHGVTGLMDAEARAAGVLEGDGTSGTVGQALREIYAQDTGVFGTGASGQAEFKP